MVSRASAGLLAIAVAGPVPAAPAMNELTAIAEHEREVQALQAEHGVYHPRLEESLIELGLARGRAGERSEAVAALRRALQVRRVNHGLYDLGQTEILDLVIELERERRNWEAVADAYDYLHWLYRRNFAPDDPRLLPVLKRLRTWHFEAYSVDTGRSLNEHFYAARAVYRQAMDIVMAQTGDRRRAICFWHEACCDASEQRQKRCMRRYAAYFDGASELE